MTTHVDEHRAWESVATLDDYAARTIDFLEGRLSWSPGHGGPPDSETAELVPALVRMNELGFVTTDSQPGTARDSNGSAQRAYVEGCCTESTADVLSRTLASKTDIVVLTCHPESTGWLSFVVTLDYGDEYTFAGRLDPSAVAEQYEAVGEGVARVARESWWIQIVDPVWGRNSVLFAAVVDALQTRALADP